MISEFRDSHFHPEGLLGSLLRSWRQDLWRACVVVLRRRSWGWIIPVSCNCPPSNFVADKLVLEQGVDTPLTIGHDIGIWFAGYPLTQPAHRPAQNAVRLNIGAVYHLSGPFCRTTDLNVGIIIWATAAGRSGGWERGSISGSSGSIGSIDPIGPIVAIETILTIGSIDAVGPVGTILAI